MLSFHMGLSKLRHKKLNFTYKKKGRVKIMMFNLLSAFVWVVFGGLFILLVLGCLITTLAGLVAIIRSIVAVAIYPIVWVIEKAGDK